VTLPTFFVIGPARCATDALNFYLGQHPQIYMSPTKETNYFVFYGRTTLDFTGPGDVEALRNCFIPTLADYKKLFRHVQDEIAVGEASPWYIYCADVPPRIQHDIPHAKLLAMLRNPIDRAYSSFGMMHRDGREAESDFLRAFQLESERIAANWEPLWHYQSMGMYSEQLQRYYDCFNRSQIRVYLYDDFDRDPVPIMRDMFRFLGVDDAFQPDMSERPNQSYVPKNAQIHSLVAKPSLVKSAMKAVIPARVRRSLRVAALESNRATAEVTREVREQLIPVFRDDILKLQDLIERDLSAWLSPTGHIPYTENTRARR
jgi:hypothetical protein